MICVVNEKFQDKEGLTKCSLCKIKFKVKFLAVKLWILKHSALCFFIWTVLLQNSFHYHIIFFLFCFMFASVIIMWGRLFVMAYILKLQTFTEFSNIYKYRWFELEVSSFVSPFKKADFVVCIRSARNF